MLMKLPALVLTLLAAPVFAATDAEQFHGWSKDGSWLVYEVHGANELDELFFCATNSEVRPSWPAVLNEMDREDLNGLSCAHFMDPNKAPYQWKLQLVLPAPTARFGGVEVSHELALDGENPGFVLIAGEKKQSCYASAVRVDSKLQKTWFHPSGRFVAAIIDGNFRHCTVTIKGAAAATTPVKPPKKR
jgi:hypothetical protein